MQADILNQPADCLPFDLFRNIETELSIAYVPMNTTFVLYDFFTYSSPSIFLVPLLSFLFI